MNVKELKAKLVGIPDNTEVYIGPRLTCTPNGLVNSVRLIDISLDDYYEEEENQPTIKAVVLDEE